MTKEDIQEYLDCNGFEALTHLDGNKYYDQKTVITTKNGKVCCDQNDDYIIFNTEKSGLCDCTYGYGCKLM